jgi:REP element-mobilizing transposase RayT
MGGIARENKMRALAIGGVDDHVHLLLSMPSTLSIAQVMQLIKGASSKWVHDTFPDHQSFEWQEGYGALVFRRCPTQRLILPINANIIAQRHSRKNSSHFWNGMELNMTRGMFGVEVRASLRDARWILGTHTQR